MIGEYNAKGQVTQEMVYLAGVPIAVADKQYYDEETGFHYNYFRTYDPSTGRYVTVDAIGKKSGLNSYSYVGGNSMNYIDPLGLAKCVYSISNTNLVCISNTSQDTNFEGPPEVRSLQSEAVHSGTGYHKNKLSSINIKEKGPIPTGIYDMLLNKKPFRDNWWTLINRNWIPKLSGFSYAMGWRRSGHNLHLGTISHGCVTVSNDYSDQYNELTGLLNKEVDNNELVVVP